MTNAKSPSTRLGEGLSRDVFDANFFFVAFTGLFSRSSAIFAARGVFSHENSLRPK